MKNKKNKKLEYLEIKSSKDLNEAITFLEKNFKWDRVKSELLERKLPIINENINIYGFMIKSNTSIVGAILFFHQGYINSGGKNKSVINLSGWYIKEEFRGMPTITFLKYIIERFDKSILTNYSANDTAKKILLAFGFRKMKLERASLLLPECILNFSNIKIKKIQKDSLYLENHIQADLNDGVGIRFLDLEVDQNNIQLIIKKRILKRSLFGIKFNWRTASIIWSSDEAIISKYWKKIAHKLMFYTKSMKLVCDFSSNFPNKAKKLDANYLFFTDDDDLHFIWPIQSEINIFD